MKRRVRHKLPNKGCFPLGGIFRAQRNFSLFVSSQAELIEKRQIKIALRAKNSAWWKTALMCPCAPID